MADVGNMHPMLGRLTDRSVFWALPGWVSAYSLPIPHHSFRYRGMEVWYIPGADDGPTVLYCHGNSGNLRFPKARRDRFLALQQTGAHLWVFDYRGYGRSAGRPTESNVFEDALAVHGLARRFHPQGRPFVLFGRSLGGAVAIYLAAEVQEPDMLLLESTFSSAADVCEGYTSRYLANQMTYRFDSASRLPRVKCPVRMIHGTNDWVVPYHLGRRLYEEAHSNKEFITIEGAGHNDLQQKAEGRYEKTLARWLGQL